MDCIIRRSLLSATSRSTASTSRTALFHSSRLARQDAPSPSTATPTPSDDNSPPPPTATEGESETSAAAAEENTVFDADTGRGGKGFRNWLNSDGARYRHGVKGKTNWLGDTPFPLNPTFNPLPPLADATKTKIYNAYAHNILVKAATDAQVVRAVSFKFGVGMDRVRAIVRLKELEKAWKEEGRTLQTNLLEGMESHLGVKQPGDNWKGVEAPEPESDVFGANKTLFEMVDVESNDSPVFLPLLAHLPKRSSLPVDAPGSKVPKVVTARVTKVPAARPGRAATVFSDLTGTTEGDKLAKTYNSTKTKRGHKKVVVEHQQQ